MMKNIFLLTALCATLSAAAYTGSYKDQVHAYIREFSELAIAEQQRVGVPAAITLAQGILETEAGNSELATQANNHFGIKCKREWKGETFAHTDDAPDECFRKYPSALHSYQDHSDYLKCNKRYEKCFAQTPTDYASWAKELKKAGYATNPAYAQRLIKIIEEYHLQDYTLAAINGKEPLLVAGTAPVTTATVAAKSQPGEVIPHHDAPAPDEDKPVYGKIVKKDGVRGFYARKGDVLLEYAIQYKVRYSRLLEINGLPDAPLARDMFVQVEKGGKVAQMIAHDASSAPTVTYVTPAKNTVIDDGKTSVTTAVEESRHEPAPNENPAALNSYTPAEEPKIYRETPFLSEPPAGATDAAASAPAAAQKPINIADEVAVEEMKPAVAEEPQDEFSKLKARLDKVVYAPVSKPKPAAPAAPATSTAQRIEKPAAPVIVSAAAGKTFHTVQRGETAFGIAKQYGVPMKELMAMNGLTFESGVKVGQKLRVK